MDSLSARQVSRRNVDAARFPEMGRKKNGLIHIEEFLTKRLAHKIKQDLTDLRIVKESDLECCIYHHLRVFLQDDNEWRVLARRYSPQTGRYPDFLIFHKGAPRVAIELKWNRGRISKKDRQSLGESISKLGVDRAYFITTLIDKPYQPTQKTKIEMERLKEIPIALGLSGSELERWKDQRKKFKHISGDDTSEKGS